MWDGKDFEMPNDEGRCTRSGFSHCRTAQDLVLHRCISSSHCVRFTYRYFKGRRLTSHLPLPPSCSRVPPLGKFWHRLQPVFQTSADSALPLPRPTSDRKELRYWWLPASPSTLSNPEWSNEGLIHWADGFVQWTWDETKSKKITFAVIKQALCLCQRLHSFTLIRLAVDPTPTPDLPPDWFLSLSIHPLIPSWGPPLPHPCQLSVVLWAQLGF